MPRYKASCAFGPWIRNEIFESEDPYHAKLAAEGRLLVEIEMFARVATVLKPKLSSTLISDTLSPVQPIFVRSGAEDDEDENED